MSNRFNNRRLLIVLSVLAAILILTMVLKIPKERATFISRLLLSILHPLPGSY